MAHIGLVHLGVEMEPRFRKLDAKRSFNKDALCFLLTTMRLLLLAVMGSIPLPCRAACFSESLSHRAAFSLSPVSH